MTEDELEVVGLSLVDERLARHVVELRAQVCVATIELHRALHLRGKEEPHWFECAEPICQETIRLMRESK